ncbi:hypothetical protein KBTX_03646 [wastewater metagenome]|uniref:Cytochrome oxidase maturation protein cbb3-type n=2 Tax=unclassified sequences TaxID=12908 RepID=A0A5B8RK86_9ZZZZ|nr:MULTISPECIES: cbb3-type cytochrome oxidase assembly protein CcoS [Arhodomonas]MCS4503180.1 cbb3-type cytochrome oxidase assembly protein CcoS [Arhodomonas aquaeolei]QEA07297.1 hypothetical protein KBTEX_03646 [uncultured organism]
MTILYVLIPLALMLLVVFVGAFFWAVGNGQFDDLDSPAYRILMDDEGPSKTPPEEGGEATTGQERTNADPGADEDADDEDRGQ